MKKAIAIVVALLLIVSAVIIIKKKKTTIDKTPAVASYPLPIDVAEAKGGSIFKASHYLGTVMPLDYADISARITGNILSVNVREGDQVHKGQLLVSIDDRALKEREAAQLLEMSSVEAQLSGAMSVYETQLSVYERDEMLYKQGAISLEALQKSKALKDSLLAQVKSLEEKARALKNIYQSAVIETSYARLYAPFDGVITKRLQEPGDLAVPGKPILRIEGTSHFKVFVQIPQTEIALMKKGGKAIISDGRDKMDATISRVYPATTVGTMGAIEIDLTRRPFNIPSGGAVSVDLITGKTDKGLVVPVNALLENQRGSFIYKITNNIIKVIKVQVLGKNAESACIIGDIKEGDIVAIGDEGKLMRLSEGMAVIPQKEGVK
ncbi:hemolysin secretion protein D [Dissulfurispira thermophila]|uniref:Hemolysin secretion protein D n=1 Tax=Dissulfurispira thermophila TaxID=2715679 RepID=A0A7G1H2P5_9BACT|nr:efflux RND transporter periplasmic adaptor subunit [Dissulfurispira thermophila]BCB97050.1 hemolysin secretion protein D [Dissulfurispira thermophila]